MSKTTVSKNLKTAISLVIFFAFIVPKILKDMQKLKEEQELTI
jgi:flagellar biogenesis protein FliO